MKFIGHGTTIKQKQKQKLFNIMRKRGGRKYA
jgi:hypothetical protein